MVVWFFVDEEEKCREKQFQSIINGKVSQSLGDIYIYIYIMKEQNFETFFFSYNKLNILRVVLMTQHYQKNSITKSRWQVVNDR